MDTSIRKLHSRVLFLCMYKCDKAMNSILNAFYFIAINTTAFESLWECLYYIVADRSSLVHM